MLKPVVRLSRISTLGYTLFIAWVPPKSERPSSTSYVAGCDTTSRRAARPTENSPENSPCPPASRFIMAQTLHMKSKHTQHAYAHKKAKRNVEAGRRGNTTRPRAKQAKCSGKGAFPRLQCNTPTARSENESDFKQSIRYSSKFSA